MILTDLLVFARNHKGNKGFRAMEKGTVPYARMIGNHNGFHRFSNTHVKSMRNIRKSKGFSVLDFPGSGWDHAQKAIKSQ